MSEYGITYQEMYDELNRYEKRGITLKMEGEMASPTQIVQNYMVREDVQYMRDYILDDEGNLKELHFNPISLDVE